MQVDLFNLANRVPFDDRVNHQAEISDLNITLIQSYLKEVKSSLYEKSKIEDFVEICRDMNIVSNLPEYVKPKNVGLMFFSMEPDKFFPYTQIDVVQFPEGLGGNDIIEQTFKGPIHQQLRDALQYIRNVIITEKVVKHPDRAEADRFFNYPYAAIEEALSNAVYHRAYDEREPIEVRVENDRIEIVSFPGPDRSVTMEGLKSYRVSNRRYRNRRIGDFLKELHLTEGRNTGFKKIVDALEVNGSPKPEFETDEARKAQRLLNLSSMEAHSITQFGRGEALLITAGSKVPLSIIACKKEHELITTDRTELKALLEKKKREREGSG